MKSSINRPTSLSAKAVQTAVLSPKHRRNPRATLYSPPPSHTLNSRAVLTRPSPGSNRSMISPRAIRSYLHEPEAFIFRAVSPLIDSSQDQWSDPSGVVIRPPSIVEPWRPGLPTISLIVHAQERQRFDPQTFADMKIGVLIPAHHIQEEVALKTSG